MKKSFEEYLQEKFNNEREFNGVSITKDNYEDLFENWIEWLDKQEVIDYADNYAKEIRDIKVEDYLEYDPATPERRAFVEGFNKAVSVMK